MSFKNKEISCLFSSPWLSGVLASVPLSLTPVSQVPLQHLLPFSNDFLSPLLAAGEESRWALRESIQQHLQGNRWAPECVKRGRRASPSPQGTVAPVIQAEGDVQRMCHLHKASWANPVGVFAASTHCLMSLEIWNDPLITAPTVIASYHKTVYSVTVSHFILFCKYVLSAGAHVQQRTERVFKMGE